MTNPDLTVHGDPQTLARAVATDLLNTLAVAQLSHPDGLASVVLTGGGMGRATLEAMSHTVPQVELDWSRIDVWWGDERFLPAGDDERNETMAREALLDHVPLDPARVHVMAAADHPGIDSAEAAAEQYRAELAAAAGDGTSPAFDVVLLGVGPDGHVASLFPGMDGVHDDRTALAVHDSPKPPPTRISLGFRAINRARQVWFVVSGEEKAEAVGAALDGASVTEIPAVGAHGSEATRWLLDDAAAGSVRR